MKLKNLPYDGGHYRRLSELHGVKLEDPLDYYDGPASGFTTVAGMRVMYYWWDDDRCKRHYVIVEVTPAVEARLRKGFASLEEMVQIAGECSVIGWTSL